MSLLTNNPNPLDYFNYRQVIFPCPQFSYISINVKPVNIQVVRNWVINNLQGRFYIGQKLVLDTTNTIVYNTHIGFEDEEEISFFIIACPHL